jgi:hypothetical protein
LLWQIPLSDERSDRVPELVKNPDTNELYKFYEFYVEDMKAQSRRRR